MGQNPTQCSNPKSDLLAEQSVLGSIMQDRTAYVIAKQTIENAQYFYFAKNRLIWQALAELIKQDKPIDTVTLHDILFKQIADGKIGMEDILEISDVVPSSAHCAHYAEIVAEYYRVRQMEKAYTEAHIALNEGGESKLVWEDVSRKTTGLFREKEKEYSIHELMEELSLVPADGQWGIPWGIPSLDQNLREFAPESIIILGARPGHGKTAFALQLMEGWANFGHRVFFQSMEMTKKELYLRRLSRLSGIEEWKIKRGPNYKHNVNNADYDFLINSAASKIYDIEKKLIINTRGGLSPEEISLNIQMAYETHGVNFFVLDHFHRVKFGGKGNIGEQEEGLELILSTCRNLKITPIILSQLSRSIESREDHEPQLTDLRFCGRLEEAANLVLFLYWKYQRTRDDADKNSMKVTCAKNRSGSIGAVNMRFFPETYSFKSDV
jgi:replicative DNA helicase